MLWLWRLPPTSPASLSRAPADAENTQLCARSAVLLPPPRSCAQRIESHGSPPLLASVHHLSRDRARLRGGAEADGELSMPRWR